MSLPPRYSTAHNGTTGMPDSLTSYGFEPADPSVVGAHSAGVVLFDPETDTSPYAAKHKKPKPAKEPKPASDEKPSVTPAARAAATKAAERTQRAPSTGRARAAAARTAQPRTIVPGLVEQAAAVPVAAPATAESPQSSTRRAASAASYASYQGSAVPRPQGAAPQRGSLRIVSNDPNEIRRYAEAQRRSEGFSAPPAPAANPYRAASAPTVPAASPNPRSARAAAGVNPTPAAAPVSAPTPPDELEAAAVAFATSVMPAVSTAVPDPTEPPAPVPPSVAERLTAARDSLRRRFMREHAWRLAMVWLTGAACVLMTVTMLYFPSQELYLAVRENERISQELDRNLARNEQMRNRVASLQTAEGIQDEATRSYGLVMPSEHAVTVLGAPYEAPATAIPPQVPRGSGTNTHSWGTALLDRVFGVVGSSATVASTADVATVSEAPAAPAAEPEAAPEPQADPNADIVAQGDA